jgi:hypothetical protein
MSRVSVLILMGAASMLCPGIALAQAATEVAEVPQAATEGAEVHSAVHALDLKLQGNPYEARWRRYLNWDGLLAQLGAERPSRVALRQILKLYTRPGTDVDRAEFARVRRALEAWIEQLYPLRDELPSLAREAKPFFTKPSDELARQQFATLQRSVAGFDQRLAAAGTTGQGWRRYLKWDVLIRETASLETAHAEPLEQVYHQLLKSQASPEPPDCAAIRRALAAVLPTVRLRNEPKAQEEYGRQLDELAVLLMAPADEGGNATDRERRERIGRILGWLEERQQAADVIDAIRHGGSYPNLLLTLSRELLAAELEANFDETEPVDEVILGSRVHGTSRTLGRVAVALEPNPQRAVIDVNLSGRATSYTVSRADRAVIHSRSITDLQASKQLQLVGDGVLMRPATASACTSTTPTSISTGRRRGDAIARSRVAQTRPQTEAISARNSEAKVSHRLDDKLTQELSQAGLASPADGGKPYAWRNPFFPSLQFSTTDRALSVVGLQADAFQLGAPAVPPPSTDAGDLILRMHESLINNRAQSLLAGQTLTPDNWRKKLSEVLGGLFGDAASLAPGADVGSGWSITLAQQDPITAQFDANTCSITVRGQSFIAGDESAPAMNLLSHYRLEGVGRFVMQDKLGIYPPGFIPGSGQRLGGRYQAVRRTLEKRFAHLFPAEFSFDRFPLPAGSKISSQLPVAQSTIADGWLTLISGRVPAIMPVCPP